jgi:serine/threonine protein kinase
MVEADGSKHPALVMELLQGGSLHDFLHCRTELSQPLTPQAQHRIALDVALGLQYLHSLGWMHRDIKPRNVLLDGATPHRAKISDFGLSTRIGVEGNPSQAGTFRYMAPEAYFQAFAPPADIYSFGILLWELIYAEQPFWNYTALRLFRKRLAFMVAVTADNVRPRLRGGPLEAPCGYAGLAAACWEIEAAKRPKIANVVAMLGELQGTPFGPPQVRGDRTPGAAVSPDSSALDGSSRVLPSTGTVRDGAEHHTAKV